MPNPASELMKMYQYNGMTMMDWRSVLGSLMQMLMFLGMYQTLRVGVNGARFLWVETLANCYSAIQTGALHDVGARRIRSGAVTI
jgi:membrane protein insertase Oxa1/YidC/SpoIIIJ